MKEKKVERLEVEIEELELVDLGDAAVETRQIAPGGHLPDSEYVLGIWSGR